MTPLIHAKTNKVLAQNVIKASHILSRLKGLMGRSHLPMSSAMWIIPCQRGIHTFFMRFPLDLIFVNRSLEITHVSHNIKPWKVVRPPGSFALSPPSYSVFEFPSPALNSQPLQKGDQLYVGH